MSLINDALKRASQSEKNRPRGPSMHSSMQAAREARRSRFPYGIVLCVVLLLTASGWLLFRYFAPRRAAPLVPVPARVVVVPAAPAPPPKAEPPPAPVRVPVPAPVVVAPPPALTNPPVAPPVPVVVPPPPPFPDLRLQGIFFSRTNPKIIINGQTRGENETINDVRVVKIYSNKATVEWQGQTKDLWLEGQ